MVWMTVGLSMIEYYNTQAAKCTAMFIVKRITFHYVLCLTLRNTSNSNSKTFSEFYMKSKNSDLKIKQPKKPKNLTF